MPGSRQRRSAQAAALVLGGALALSACGGSGDEGESTGSGATAAVVEGDTITDRGRHLMRLYSDMDLVAAESLRDGLWDELTPSELAAVLSSLVYEARRPDDASPPRVPNPAVQDALGATIRLWGRLDTLEKDHHLDFLREPDLGFAWASYRWAEGDDLDQVLLGVDLAAGDFVRWMKQLLDLCGQVADAAGDAPLRWTARQAVKQLKRGVVGWSTLND